VPNWGGKIKSPGRSGRADLFFSSFNPEPTATASFPRFIAVAVGSGLNEVENCSVLGHHTARLPFPAENAIIVQDFY
jgi:hypothetical protein